MINDEVESAKMESEVANGEANGTDDWIEESQPEVVGPTVDFLAGLASEEKWANMVKKQTQRHRRAQRQEERRRRRVQLNPRIRAAKAQIAAVLQAFCVGRCGHSFCLGHSCYWAWVMSRSSALLGLMYQCTIEGVTRLRSMAIGLGMRSPQRGRTTGYVCPSVNSVGAELFVAFIVCTDHRGYNARATHQGEVCNYRPVHECICIFIECHSNYHSTYDSYAQCDRLLSYRLCISSMCHTLKRYWSFVIQAFICFAHMSTGTCVVSHSSIGRSRTQLDRAPSVGTGSSCERRSTKSVRKLTN